MVSSGAKDLKASIKELTKIKATIAKANSFKEIQNLEFPTSLYLANANDMYQAILQDYYNQRKLALSGVADFLSASSIPLREGDTGGVSSSIPISSKSPSGASEDYNFEIDWTLEDTKALNAFRAEAFIVAGVTSDTLLDTIKSEAEKAFTQGITFNDFKENLKLQGFEPDNPHYLRTNFNQAIKTARAVSDWKGIEDLKEIFPYLEYQTMQDDAVRDEHVALDGIVRHVDDPFWDENMPPNGWGCRCLKPRQLTKEEGEGSPGINKPEPPETNIKPEFRRNPGKDNSLFGDWLGCNDAKNLTTTYPQMSIRSKRLHIFNSGKQHCPDLYAKSHKDLDQPDWNKWKKNKEPDYYVTDNKTKEELLKDYSNYLGSRTLAGHKDTPIFLDKGKSDKFLKETYTVKDIAGRMKYMYAIDDVLKNPDEAWLDKNKTRVRYLKKYSKNVVLVVDIIDGQYEYFNILTISKDKEIDKLRKGFLLK